jgi:hypothetical protein
MVNTHMACGLMSEGLMVRVGKAGYEAALADGAEVMEFTGRPMRGMVLVRGPAVADHDSLASWVERGVAFAKSEPPKAAKKPKPRN